MLVQGKWLVKWSPATIAPQLGAGDQLSLQTTWPARAAILGADGTPLTSQGQVVTIGVEGARIKNAASLRSALVAAGAPAAAVSTALTAARTHPTYFEPVFTVTRARYEQLQPTIYPIPGTVFQSEHRAQRRHAWPDRRGRRHGRPGDGAGTQPARRAVHRAGRRRPDRPGQADERQLAGHAAATVSVVSASGAHVATVATLPSRPGTPVSTTIEPSVQRAAEAALAGEEKSAALVAVNASTGAVLAAVSANSAVSTRPSTAASRPARPSRSSRPPR